MPKKAKFSARDEEKLINFVKNNEILYNTKIKGFRDIEAKHNLWMQLAKQLNKDVGVVKRRWKMMRDYYIRSKKMTTGLSASTPKSVRRDKSLSFLIQTSILNTSHISSLATVVEPSTDPETQSQDDSCDIKYRSVSPESISQSSEHRSLSRMSATYDNETLREPLVQPQKASDLMLQQPNDDIEFFFKSMALTVRKLSRVSIARIKVKVANIVGEEEIAWAAGGRDIEHIYLDEQGDQQESI